MTEKSIIFHTLISDPRASGKKTFSLVRRVHLLLRKYRIKKEICSFSTWNISCANFPKPNKYIAIITDMREWKYDEYKEARKARPSSSLFHQSTLFHVPTVGGSGADVAALVAWDSWHRLIPRRQWGRSVRVGGGGWETKNASCSELGGENASYSENRGSRLPGVDGSTCASGSPVRA